ncbi:MAG: 30S ribosomal protein S8 [Rickettsiales bacterium]
MNDSIADMITRIRNGQSAYLVSIKSPYSKFREAVLGVLKAEGYIASYTVSSIRGDIKELDVKLKYSKDGSPVIQEIKKVSKPGRRSYSGISSMKPVYNNLGVSIISTPSGVMTDRDARAKGVGGEVICQVF